MSVSGSCACGGVSLPPACDWSRAAFRSSFQSFPDGFRRSNLWRRSLCAASSPALSLSKAQTRRAVSASLANHVRGSGVVPAVETTAWPRSPASCRSLKKADGVDGGFDQVDRCRPGDVSDTEPAAVLPASRRHSREAAPVWTGQGAFDLGSGDPVCLRIAADENGVALRIGVEVAQLVQAVDIAAGQGAGLGQVFPDVLPVFWRGLWGREGLTFGNSRLHIGNGLCAQSGGQVRRSRTRPEAVGQPRQRPFEVRSGDMLHKVNAAASACACGVVEPLRRLRPLTNGDVEALGLPAALFAGSGANPRASSTSGRGRARRRAERAFCSSMAACRRSARPCAFAACASAALRAVLSLSAVRARAKVGPACLARLWRCSAAHPSGSIRTRGGQAIDSLAMGWAIWP